MMANEISFFPTLYPGEDFRSTIYRYHILSRNKEFYESKLDLFNVHSNKNTFFSRNLEYFISRLSKNSNLTTEYILNNHTVFPFYKAFMSTKKIDLFYEDIKYGRSESSSFAGRIVNATGPKLLSKEPKYCPKCMENELSSIGECFLHIGQQLHFLEICSEHGVKLISECPVCGLRLSNLCVDISRSSSNCICGHEFTKCDEVNSNEIHAFQMLIADELFCIAKNRDKFSQEKILEQYNIILWNKGYFHDFTGEISKKSLLSDMMNYYTEEQLLAIGIDSEYICSIVTQRNFLSKNNMHNHIILHILLMRFLCGSISNFFEIHPGYSVSLPFGLGPWKCLNQICPEHNQPSIMYCNRYYASSIFYGEFQCRVCGFTYAKRICLNRLAEDEEHYSIRFMGHMWIKTICELREKGHTQKDIAKILKVTPLTINKYIKKMDESSEKFDDLYLRMSKMEDSNAILELIATTKETSSTSNFEEKINRYRKNITRIVLDGYSRTEIRSKAATEYNYLIKNDKQWMKEQLPAQGYAKRIDCEKLDIELSNYIEQAAREVYASDPPTRIRRFSIVNALPEKQINQYNGNRKKLPRCTAALIKFEESQDEYLIRHAPKIVSQLLDARYRNVTFNSIVAIRSSYRNCSDEARQKIEEMLVQMGMDIG
ncbi:TnsD family Tn7-like transposition protein [Paenibacillus sp. D2_2]|uniref:TnsD family Tn7-like transposition protein n=1 Tax=Paenibacillus sp. D2_2 TaxID=3073092 RepID=UPI0028166A26|nr:TnsD family Tn7-like transposition protein [Paenibacillus sp. D2_2]WMT40493.1 TnsD family Tn7-like transposition protein [Paenibacillus sp. D2_2]